jgi:rhodanese-related sulfurtransferase
MMHVDGGVAARGTPGDWLRWRGLLPAALLALALAWPAGQLRAQETAGPVISADDALRLAESGQVVLVDVRSPQEWRQTGVPSGAQTVTIHNPNGLVGFLGAMEGTLGADPNQAIAVICARGNRSTLAQSALKEAGYTQVFNIREGMFGSTDGPGWLARGLPTDDCSGC